MPWVRTCGECGVHNPADNKVRQWGGTCAECGASLYRARERWLDPDDPDEKDVPAPPETESAESRTTTELQASRLQPPRAEVVVRASSQREKGLLLLAFWAFLSWLSTRLALAATTDVAPHFGVGAHVFAIVFGAMFYLPALFIVGFVASREEPEEFARLMLGWSGRSVTVYLIAFLLAIAGQVLFNLYTEWSG